MKNFAMIGAAGFVALRYLRAIKETNNQLLVALDKFDSVGVIDSYLPDASFLLNLNGLTDTSKNSKEKKE